MHDLALIAIASGLASAIALGRAAWHTWKLELHRHDGADLSGDLPR